ncbi:MAG: hypothetical protein LBV52_04375 [Spirochaetaceae bacterium]|jgi:hypothetical protein|nr:hypothetical protein [Spirochaetaceae bacterium]
MLLVFTIIAFTGFFNLIEAKFYDRIILNDLNKNLSKDTDIIDEYINSLESRFLNVLSDDSVKRSFLVNQSSEDIFERSKLFGQLEAAIKGLQWVRFIDKNGQRIHYSTNGLDRAQQTDNSVSYKSYTEVNDYVPFDEPLLRGEDTKRLVFSDENQCFSFYFPFYDSFDVYRGEAIFSLSIRTIADKLLSNSRIKASEDVSIISNPKGIVIGLSDSTNLDLKRSISSIWNGGITLMNVIDLPENLSYVLLTNETSQNVFVGSLADESLFDLPDILKIILLLSFSLSSFLLVFLIFNVKQNPVTIIQGRLKELQVNLLKEYYEIKADIDWAAWRAELEERRESVRGELKRGLNLKKDGDIETYINSFFDKSWDDLINALGNKASQAKVNFDEAKMEELLKRVLSATKIYSEASSAAEEKSEIFENVGAESEEPEEPGEIEELEELEEFEDPGEADAAGVSEKPEALKNGDVLDEEVEEIEEIGEIEDLDDKVKVEDPTEPEEALENLNEAEPSFFMDTEEIAEKIEEMVEKSKKIKPINLFEPSLTDEDLPFELDVAGWKPSDTLSTDLSDADEIADTDEITESGEIADADEIAEAGEVADADEADAWQQLSYEAEEIAVTLEEPGKDQNKNQDEEIPVENPEADAEIQEEVLQETDEDEASFDGDIDFTVDVSDEDENEAMQEDEQAKTIESLDEEGKKNENENEGEQIKEETLKSDDENTVQYFENATESDIEKYQRKVSTGPSYTFENPHKGTDYNAIAKKIEFGPSTNSNESDIDNADDEEDDNFDLSLDISSPMRGLNATQGDDSGDIDDETDNDYEEDANAIDVIGAIDTDSVDDMDDADDMEKVDVPEIKFSTPVSKKTQVYPAENRYFSPTPFSYRPFSSQSTGDLEFLENAGSEEESREENILAERDGVTYIDQNALKNTSIGSIKIDRNIKKLVDSVLGNI